MVIGEILGGTLCPEPMNRQFAALNNMNGPSPPQRLTRTSFGSRLQVGRGVEAGLAVVVLAILIDRIIRRIREKVDPTA
ncbi:hypothetical protein [Mesorhizobium sp. M0500]|uniref:hypothetical protein n=1 Tax=Mesorhizobium sp. M0500 TaxID=2956953 RepID=UPI00333C75B7